MPLAAVFLGSIGQLIYRVLVYLVGAQYAMRAAAVMSIATIYISCVVYYSTVIYGWLQGILMTAYGAFLGLLFPPIAGSVIASLGAYWTCVYGVQYVSSLTKIAVGK